MSSLINSLGVDRLTCEEQLRLVGEILDNLATHKEWQLTDAQRRELDRRLAVLDAGATSSSPWPAVEARVLARLRR